MKCSWCTVPEDERKCQCLEKTVKDIQRKEVAKQKAKTYEKDRLFIKNKWER